jgi:hypothetical protein
MPRGEERSNHQHEADDHQGHAEIEPGVGPHRVMRASVFSHADPHEHASDSGERDTTADERVSL